MMEKPSRTEILAMDHSEALAGRLIATERSNHCRGEGVQRASRLAAVGALISDAARCRMLMALGGGAPRSARLLAEDAGVKPATASSHLMKLVSARFLDVE